MKRSAQVIVAAGIAAAIVAAVWLFKPRAAVEPELPAHEAALPVPADKPAPIQAPADTAQAGLDLETKRKLQGRLDAIAQAYNDGNAKAIEAALWQNHAVVRPNGENLDRAGVVAQWQREWEQFDNRELKLAVISAERQGERVQASWSVDLTADVDGEDGQPHRFEFHGVQNATYRIDGGEELLDGPITYSVFDQTMDGQPWGQQ